MSEKMIRRVIENRGEYPFEKLLDINIELHDEADIEHCNVVVRREGKRVECYRPVDIPPRRWSNASARYSGGLSGTGDGRRRHQSGDCKFFPATSSDSSHDPFLLHPSAGDRECDVDEVDEAGCKNFNGLFIPSSDDTTALQNSRSTSRLSDSSVIEKTPRSSQSTTCLSDSETFSLDLQKFGKIQNKESKWVFRGKFGASSLCPERHVAVKILGAAEIEERTFKYDASQTESMRRRMKREPCHLHELIHPNVVQYIHSWSNDGGKQIYIIMELCHHETLEDRIQNKDKRLQDPSYRKAVMLQIMQGLRYIHSNRICHRDIKPSNILFSSDERVVKISDFGFSKKVHRETEKISSTTTTATDGYRPPETYIQEKDGTAAEEINYLSDIFSLGLVFFNILSMGIHPFGENVQQQSYNIMAKQGMQIEGLTGPDAGLARDLIKNMLKYNRDDRPNATEILEHPYFWDTEKIVGFYIRVDDHFSAGVGLQKLGRKKINLKEAVSIFVDDRHRVKETHPKAVALEQARSYFAMAKQARNSSEHLSDVNKMLKLLYESLDARAQKYIRVLNHVIKRAESLTESSVVWLTVEYDSNPVSGSDSNHTASSNLNINDPRTYISPKSDSESKVCDLEKLSMDEKATDEVAKRSGKAENKVSKDRCDDDCKGLAERIVDKILTEIEERGQTLEHACALLAKVTTDLFKPIITIIDKIDTVPNPGSSDFRTLETTGKCTTSCHTNLRLRDEFYPRDIAQGFKEQKTKIKAAARAGKVQDTINAARAILSRHETSSQQVWNEKGANDQETSNLDEKDNLLSKINSLSLIRRNDNEAKWKHFAQHVNKCENSDSPSDFLTELVRDAGDLIYEEQQGKKRSWHECLEHEITIHGTNCSFEMFVEEAKCKRSRIQDMISHTRNKLAHFEDNKRLYGKKWVQKEDDLLHFISAAIPELLPHVYHVMKSELRDYVEESEMQKNSFVLPEINQRNAGQLSNDDTSISKATVPKAFFNLEVEADTCAQST